MAVEVRRTAEAPPVSGGFASLVEARLEALLEAERARWTDLDPDLAAPITTLLGHVRSGGKRLRPTFCHLAFTGAGGEPGDALAVDAGAALELLHAFALLHDDVMDDASQRRGAPTAHVVWEEHHEGGAWRGEARRFGEGVAVLVGDLAAVYADRLLCDVPRPARRLYDDLRVELVAGQFLDLLHTARGGVRPGVARRIAVLKSARYTVERPLQLGAALVGRLDDLGEGLSAYGLPLGEAFQLRDDLLGAFGDPVATGKPVGDDLREGKPTLLLALALERATPVEADVLARAGTSGLDDDDVADLQEVLVATGARAAVEAMVGQLTDEAVTAAGRLRLTSTARHDLVALAEHLAWRDR